MADNFIGCNLRSVRFNLDALGYVDPEKDRERQLLCQDFQNHAVLYPTAYQKDDQFDMLIGVQQQKISLEFTDMADKKTAFILSLSAYVRLMKEYMQICDAYKHAVLYDNMSTIETIDMARRGLHNQAADLLSERLSGKIDGNYEGFRLLFSVIKLII